MGQPKLPNLTADEFIAWAMEQPTGRFELDDGVVVAMAPERVRHSRAKAAVWLALRTAVNARGLACEALPDGVSVRINDLTVYGPDVVVRCGAPLPGDAIEMSDPVIVVEVVSPSSRGTDSGVKLVGYFSLSSVRHYLIVDADKRIVIHHRRGDDDAIGVRVLRAGPLALDPPGLAIELGDVFSAL